MIRFLFSLAGGLIVGLVIGLYLSYIQFPLKYVDSPANALEQRYKDDYTVMIANGYLVDHDANGAVERLSVLGVDNVPQYVQEVTERYITNSREVSDIRSLVALAEGLGRLTPIMQPYRQVSSAP